MIRILLLIFLTSCKLQPTAGFGLLGLTERHDDTHVTNVSDNSVERFSIVTSKGSCTQIPGEQVWVENVRGQLLDVYYNDKCADNLGEYCDNVVPSFGRSGVLSNTNPQGSGTSCVFNNLEITGHKDSKSATDIEVFVTRYL